MFSKSKIFTKYKRSKNLNQYLTYLFVFARNQFMAVLSETLLYDEEIKHFTDEMKSYVSDEIIRFDGTVWILFILLVRTSVADADHIQSFSV